MTDMDCLTPEEKNAIQEFKNRIKDKLTTPALKEDTTIPYRFLKARDFNLDKAEKMLMKHIEWRKVFQVDTFLETFKPKEYFLNYLDLSTIGLDKEGNIVKYTAAGRLNITDIVKCITTLDYVKHLVWFGQKTESFAKQQVKKTGKLPSLCLIFDLDKLDFHNATSKKNADNLILITHLLQDNYPERMKYTFVINAPSYFVLIYTIVKAVMSNATLNKIHLFGYNGWKEKLLELIDPEVLPAFLGGKRTDPNGDPYCKSFVNFPGKTPEKYYLSEEERYLKNPAKISSFVIRPSEMKEISVHVKEAGSLIQWKFIALNKSICFGLFFQESQTMRKEIIPMYEYDTSDGAEENSYKCFSLGKYIMIFDNSCSMFTSKEIRYIVSVEKPKM